MVTSTNTQYPETLKNIKVGYSRNDANTTAQTQFYTTFNKQIPKTQTTFYDKFSYQSLKTSESVFTGTSKREMPNSAFLKAQTKLIERLKKKTPTLDLSKAPDGRPRIQLHGQKIFKQTK